MALKISIFINLTTISLKIIKIIMKKKKRRMKEEIIITIEDKIMMIFLQMK